MYDLYSDTAHGLAKKLLTNNPEAAALIKEAEFEDTREEIPRHAFAWPERSLFPVHTPEHAVLSYLYADAQQAPAYVLSKIAEALGAYGVPAPALNAPVEKTASPQECLFDNGTYPVRNAEEVKIAEERLLPQADRLPLQQRVHVFHKLASAADRHGVDLAPVSQAWGLSALSNPQLVADALYGRMALSKTAEEKRGYRDILEALNSDSTQLRSYDARVKLASVLMNMDAAAGITRHYGRKIPDPMCSVFNTPVKTGAQLVPMGDDSYDLVSLSSLPLNFYSDALGPEVVSEIAPGGQIDPELVAAVLPTLPSDQMKMFKSALVSAGVRPTGV